MPKVSGVVAEPLLGLSVKLRVSPPATACERTLATSTGDADVSVTTTTLSLRFPQPTATRSDETRRR